MSDRDEEQRNDQGREGFGDDGGTRVGRPDPAQSGDAHTGPSSQPVEGGLEGSIFDGDEDAHGRTRHTQSGGLPTGAGAEAAEGAHDAMESRPPSQNSGVDAADNERRGSEPLTSRQHEHESGYGGRGGQPRSSSDQRE